MIAGVSHGLIVVQARAIFKSEVSRITSSGLRFQQIDSLEGCWYSGHIYGKTYGVKLEVDTFLVC